MLPLRATLPSRDRRAEGIEGRTMSACAQCGTVAKPTDKFCNVCGTPIAAGPPAAAPQPAYSQQPQFGAPPQAPPGGQFGAPPPGGQFGGPPPGFGGPPPGFGAPPQQGGAPGARCQMGHDIAPGASYCNQGHPIALDQMQFGAPAGAPQGFAPPQPASPYGAPPPPQQAQFGAPAPAFGASPQPPGAFGAPPPGFGGPPAQAGYAPPPQQAYAPPPQPGYAPPAAPAFGAPPGAPAFGAPPVAEPGAAPAKVLRGFLIAYGSNPSGDFWPLVGGRMLVGRLAQTDGIDVTLQDPTISSRHAALNIDANSGSIAVEDTGSTNGTFVNDEHIGFNGRRELRDGDKIRFGGFTTIVKVIGRI
jgi:hypothetical protein